MDIYCVRCGEPVELDYLHDVAAEQESTYSVVLAAFQSKGCEALGQPQCQRDPSMRSEAMSAMFDILGDDVDGAASMMEDFDFMGMLDEDGES